MRARRPATLAAVTVLTLGLAACGSATDGGSATTAPAAASSSSAAPSSSAPESPAASSSSAAPQSSSAAPESSSAAPKAAPGAYIDLAAYEADKAAYDEGTVVLFFNASWCPTCQEATGNLEADPTALGDGLTVVSVDYDSNTDLRKQYGITYQHTFVQIDPDGAEVAKWSGSSTPQEIRQQVA